MGNSSGYFTDGRFVRVGTDYLHHYASMPARLLPPDHGRFVVGLAVGYGGMADYLIPALWNSGRRSDTDEHEYLYRRRAH